jgi:deazaflavin-dependent oxidoreductase (nitroreductase family)
LNIEELAVDSARPHAATHARQYLETNGAEVDHPAVGSLILLYTRGRKSGEIRRTPLRFFDVGEDLVAAASFGGSPSHPDWYLNLIDNPSVWVRRDADFFEARAVPIEGPERDRLWDEVVVERVPQFADYQARTERIIPLVRIVAKP